MLDSCYTACFDGEIRLFNSNYTYDNGLQTVQGHVLVCFNGSYLPICDLGWDNSDAQVVCNQRFGSNYSKRGKSDMFIELLKSCFFIFMFAVGEVFSPRFPLNFTGSTNYVAQDVMCNGTEFSVSQCSYSPPTSACYMGNRAAGVTCREGEYMAK